MNNKVLKKIIFPKGEIIFTNIIASGTNSGIPFLEKITIKDNNLNEVLEYSLEYNLPLTPTNTQFYRILNKISKTENSQILPFYEFEYVDVNSAQGIGGSQEYIGSQDLWGFYNGNTGGKLYDDSDRYVSFENSVKGALQKIKYPTGGYTEIEYEQNEVDYVQRFSDADFYCEDIVYNKIFTKSISVDEEFEEYIEIEENQIIKIEIETRAENNGGEAYATVSGSFSPHSFGKCTGSSNIFPYNDVGTQAINEGIPKISNHVGFHEVNGSGILINMNTNSYGGVSASITISYYDPSIITNTPVGGIRVKKTTDCDANTNCYSKKYSYIDENGKSSGGMVTTPAYITYYTFTGSPCGSVSYILKSVQSNVPMSTYQGSHIIYNRVETLVNENINNGKTIDYFSNYGRQANSSPWGYKDYLSWRKGKLEIKEIFISNDINSKDYENNEYNETLSYEVSQEWSNWIDNNLALGLKASWTTREIIPGGCIIYGQPQYEEQFDIAQSIFYPRSYNLTKSTKVVKYGTNEVNNVVEYIYDDLMNVIKEEKKTTSRSTKTIIKKIDYAHDMLTQGDDPVNMQKLIDANRIAEPIQTKTYEQIGTSPETLLSTQKTTYQEFGSNNLLLPNIIQTSKGDNDPENRIIYHNYDNYGNPTEISKAGNFKHIFYIWGYNHSQPIAKIEGLPSISTTIIQGFDALNYSIENDVITALTDLRTTLPNAMITTFTYKPLIGVSTITDPKGDTQYFHYDDFNRLQYVKDQEGNILSENQYHYRD